MWISRFNVKGLWFTIACALAIWGDFTLRAQEGFAYAPLSRGVGYSDGYGFATWSAELFQLSFAEQRIPCVIVFSTDPRRSHKTSPLGQYWSLPFFESSVVFEGQYTLRWNAPSGVVYFLERERGVTGAKKDNKSSEARYVSTEGSWIASRSTKNGPIEIINEKAGYAFKYENGFLISFSFDRLNQGNLFRIRYDARGRPLAVVAPGRGDAVMGFLYDDAKNTCDIRYEAALGQHAQNFPCNSSRLI